MQVLLGAVFMLIAVLALYMDSYSSFGLSAPKNTHGTVALSDSSYTPAPPDFVAPQDEPPSTDSSGEALAAVAAGKQKTATLATPAPDPKAPARLTIPSLDVDAKVQSVGIAATGNISAPQGFSDVGWYRYGAAPGEKGSVIIDGHVDNGLFKWGVFKHLDRIKAGDRVNVTTGAGKTFTYVVSNVVAYTYTEVPMESIVHQKDSAQMVLITCTGKWIPAEKTYDQRLVVYATLPTSPPL